MEKGFKIDYIILIILVLAGIGFMNLSSYLIIIAFVIMILSQNFSIDRIGITLIIFSLMYWLSDYIINQTVSSFASSLRIFIYPGAYVIGNSLSVSRKENFHKLVYFLSGSMACHGIINFFFNLSHYLLSPSLRQENKKRLANRRKGIRLKGESV